jgi:hypothetical protein
MANPHDPGLGRSDEDASTTGAGWAADDLVDPETAARLLEVTVDRLDVLVADGLLEPVPGRSDRVFPVDAVMAVRQQGG